jgi:hypothetical protein
MAGATGQPPASGLGYYGFALTGAQAGGSGGVSAVRVQAYVREKTADRPYGVVNDYVASAVGRLAGIPIPPGMLVELGGGTYGYLSLAFSHRGDRPPPVIFSKFAVERPWETTSIILFDQWVGNSDRNDDNLAYLPSQGVAAFDHDLAILARPPGDAGEALRAARDLEIKSHPLAPYLPTAVYFDAWAERISSVMTSEMRRVVDDCIHAHILDRGLCDDVLDYLEHRKTRTLDYVKRTKSEYMKVSNWPLNEGEASHDR